MWSHHQVTLDTLNGLSIPGTLLNKHNKEKCLLLLINNSIQVPKVLVSRAYTNNEFLNDELNRLVIVSATLNKDETNQLLDILR